MKKILFVCKHNLFRSKIAEIYFRKINKQAEFQASSAGVIKGDLLNKNQLRALDLQKLVAKKFGINIKRNPRGLSTKLLKNQDLIIIVANDVPKVIFNNKSYIKKVVFWKIFDINKGTKEEIENIIKLIIKKVDELVKNLK
jgi:protein-tyrosine-phosphatase